MEQAHQILKDVFGFDAFRLTQEHVIERLIVQNQSALVLFPTGGGKSLCYQVPALCLDGLTLVVSPLIALMKDQVDALRAKGVKASQLDSSLTGPEAIAVKASVMDGSLKLLYVAPERLNNESFVEMMRHVKIALLAVDESHCISQWGSSFRPEYLKIARAVEELEVERCLCLTATATPDIANDICTSFNIDPEEGIFKTPVYRPNLSFLVDTARTFNEKIDKVAPVLQARTGPSIVYVTTQRQCDEVADALKKKGIESKTYHAGMKSEERKVIQEFFMTSAKGIVVCTIAFGMGIDKSNIRQVIHLFLPKTLENYSQEVGRAGRDGLPSTCLMFLCANDIPILESFARGDTCSKTSVELWMMSVFLKAPAEDGCLEFNHYEQSRLFDMRMNVLNLCFAQLELNYEYIRATTPMYSIFNFTPMSEQARRVIESSNSGPATYVRMASRKKSTGTYEIDVVASASDQCSRAELARQISKWEIDGLIESKGTQVRNRYNILRKLPSTTEEIAEMAEKMYQGMVQREEDSVRRLNTVIGFASGDKCLAQALAAYFGSESAVPNGRCDNCTICLSGRVPFDRAFKSVPEPFKVQSVLNACPDRDDARMLARLAFGISSPRLTAAGLTKGTIFGCLDNVDFRVLLDVFTAECEKAGWKKAEGVAEGSVGKKRAYTGSQTYGGGRGASSSSTRGTAKRGRYSK